MIRFDFTVTDEQGLHARPTGQLVQEAKNLTSKITITKGEKSADLSRLIGVMLLGVKQNDIIRVEVTGPEEEKDAEYIRDFLRNNF